MTEAPGGGNGGGGAEGAPDAELERLKARRLAEMRARAQEQEAREGDAEAGARARPSPREALVSALGHRGAEVLEAAERQYPAQAPSIVDELGMMVIQGQLPGGLDGGALLTVFRSVGINVRLNTRITVEQDGKMVSLSDRLGRGGGAGAAAGR